MKKRRSIKISRAASIKGARTKQRMKEARALTLRVNPTMLRTVARHMRLEQILTKMIRPTIDRIAKVEWK